MPPSDPPTRDRRSFTPVTEEHINRVYNRYHDRGAREDDIALVKAFVAEKRAKSSGTPMYIKTVIYALLDWAEFCPAPLRGADIGDVFVAMSRLDGAKKANGAPRFGRSSRHIHRTHLKAFLRWMRRRKINRRIDPDDIAEITGPGQNPMPFQFEDLLTAQEIEAMLIACTAPRDRAIIALLYEGALRPIEVGTLRWKDVTITDDGVRLNVLHKTDRPRTIICPLALPYVVEWKNFCAANLYPPTGESLVFCSNKTRVDPATGATVYYPLTARPLTDHLQRIAKRAGVDRFHMAYQFRHTRITDLLNAAIPESQVMQLSHGGRTEMFKYYAHVTDSDAERSIRELYGLAPRDEDLQKKLLKPQQCPRCREINGVGVRYCSRCGTALTTDGMDETERMFRRIAEDPVQLARIIEDLKKDE